MRRRRSLLGLSQDSFLDIMTNALGVMVLVAVAVVLQSGSMAINLGTPVVQDPPRGAARVLYECRDQHVVRLDDVELDQILDGELKMAFPGEQPTAYEANQHLAAEDVGTKHHSIRVIRRGTEIRLREGPQGESIVDLLKDESEFRKSLKRLNPKKKFAFFIVHGDSFDAFQVARRIARKRGLEVGWEPHETGAPIQFGRRGRRGDKVQ